MVWCGMLCYFPHSYHGPAGPKIFWETLLQPETFLSALATVAGKQEVASCPF